MKKMSEARQRILLKGLDRSADYVKEGKSVDEAIAKVSIESNLTPPETVRLVECFNKANTVAFMKTASQEERSLDYQLASTNKVMQLLHKPISKSAVELQANKYSYFTNKTPMQKVASVNTPRPTMHIDPDMIFKTASRSKLKLETKVRELRADIAYAEKTVSLSLDKMASLCHTLRTPKDLKKTASEIMACYGEQGRKLINATNASNSNADKYLPNDLPAITKISMTNDSDIMQLAKQATEALDGLLLNKYLKHKLTKEAADEEITLKEITPDKFMADLKEHNPEEYVRELEGIKDNATYLGQAKELDKQWQQQIKPGIDNNYKHDRDASSSLDMLDPYTGMVSGHWDAMMKAIKNKDRFMDLYINDSQLIKYPLEDVQRAYNGIVESMPELAKKQMWLKAALRKTLAQEGAVDLFEMKDMLSSAESLGKRQAKEIDSNNGMITDDKKGSVTTNNISIPLAF